MKCDVQQSNCMPDWTQRNQDSPAAAHPPHCEHLFLLIYCRLLLLLCLLSFLWQHSSHSSLKYCSAAIYKNQTSWSKPSQGPAFILVVLVKNKWQSVNMKEELFWMDSHPALTVMPWGFVWLWGGALLDSRCLEQVKGVNHFEVGQVKRPASSSAPPSRVCSSGSSPPSVRPSASACSGASPTTPPPPTAPRSEKKNSTRKMK